MKLIKLLTLLGVLMSSIVNAQNIAYKAVYDLTSGDSKNWESLLNNLENVKKDLSGVRQKVIVHGGGLSFLLKETKFQEERMIKLSEMGIDFIACENTMKRKNVAKTDLYSFAKTVPAGVAEIIKSQQEGWAYIKIGN